MRCRHQSPRTRSAGGARLETLGEALPLHARADARAACGPRGRRRADRPPPRARFPRRLRQRARPAERRLPNELRRVALHGFRDRCHGVGGREPLRARRPSGCRQPRIVRRALDRDLRAIRSRRAGASLRLGRRSGRRRGGRGGARVGRRARALPAVRHLDGRRLGRARNQGGSWRRIARRRRDLVPRRRPARDRRLGDRRRRLRLAEGAHVPTRACDGLCAGARAPAREAVAQLLLRLAQEQEGTGRPRCSVHTGRLADPQP